MKKITITATTMKAVNEALAVFSTAANSIRFEFGVEDKAQAEHEEEICACATLVNGGMQVKKGFYAARPEDYESRKEGNTVVPYAVFYCKAEPFLSYSNALLSYSEAVCMELDDEKSLTLSVGDKASVALPLVSEEEADTLLPEEYKKAVVAVTLQTDRFLAFARKGCYLSDEKDHRNIADRILLTVSGTSMTGYSTDCYSLASAWMGECKVKFLKENLAMFLLARKKDGMDDAGKESFTARVKDALDRKEILGFAEKEGLDLEKFSFSLLVSSFANLKKIVTGTKMFQLAVTDNFCYINTGSTMATFTLGSSLPTVYKTIEAFHALPVSAKAVVDCRDLLNGVGILNLDTESVHPIRLRAEENSLSLKRGKASVSIPYVEKDISTPGAEVFISGSLLKQSLGAQDNGNVCLTLYDKEGAPIEMRNGSLTDQSDAIAFVLGMKPAGQTEEEDAEQASS